MESKTLCETSDKRFALLIDADNVSARYIKPILNELSKYGTVTIKRIYGDWTLTLHSKWKDALLENSITPIQQFGYTQGKNATDSAMIIDAMDLLYTDNVDGFCLVSSDSDFTRLASRLRESGRTVIGMGEKKTPVPFRRACDVFTTLELLVQNKRDRNGGGNEVPKDAVEQAVVDIITDNQNNGKATGLGEIGSRLQKRYPDFDVRSYGTNLLSKLLEEFTRVRITKDHSSVTVELADAPEEKADRGERAAERAGERGAEGAGAAAEEDVPPKGSRRSRSHRGTRRVAAKQPSLIEGAAPVAALPQGGEEMAEAAAKPVPAGESRVAIEASVAPQEQAPEVAAKDAEESVPDVKPDVKPGRRARAERKAKQERREETTAAAEAAEAVAVEEVSRSETDAAAPAPKSRRGRRTTKKAAAEAAAAEAVSVVEPVPGAEAAAENSTPESEVAAAPKSRRGRKSAKKAATEPAAAEAVSASESAPGTAPASGAAAAASKPRRGRKSAKKAAPDASTPAGYILQLVSDAGADGIMLSTITDRVRGEFKDFKVRDLGYPQMRQYMASTGDYALEQSGRNFRVRLAK